MTKDPLSAIVPARKMNREGTAAAAAAELATVALEAHAYPATTTATVVLLADVGEESKEKVKAIPGADPATYSAILPEKEVYFSAWQQGVETAIKVLRTAARSIACPLKS